ncbi:hypothetical protein DITRI_Ditri02bG0164500 [Diplodiscus trichospermus]
MEQDTSIRAIIHNWKRGSAALLHMRWAAAFGFHISVVGLVGVVGFILAIRDGKSGEKRKKHLEKLCFVPGLQNLGNNCFLNVILQALASCSYFQSFLEKIIDKCESSPIEGQDESLPLTITLSALLAELGMAGERKVALSPHKVMRALALYIQNFDLTSQQDAAEAFLHLLSSLREEVSDIYLPRPSTLADVFASQTSRILAPQRKEDQSDQERWQQHFLGPFDGIVGSILTCQSCSSQITLDFQFFHSLPLLPVLYGGSIIMAGCTLEDCIRQFVLAEKVENYYCSHCWHIAAIKYLFSTGASEMEIEKLKRCSAQESCDCRSFRSLERLPWSNNFSNTLKQLSIARSPKILCIHLQRASVNEFGELIKLQVEIKNWGGVHRGQVKPQNRKPSPRLNLINVQSETICSYISKSMGEKVSSEILAANDFQFTIPGESFLEKSNMSQTDRCSKASHTNMHEQHDDKVSSNGKLPPSETKLYRLVSVVEHFGRPGAGHYTVYRSMRDKSDEEDSDEYSEPATTKWFCISDSQVCTVSENDVLAAEASLLFYERIMEGFL